MKVEKGIKQYIVVEKKNHNVVHCHTWSRERALKWIEENGNSNIFMDKTLNRDSFCVAVEYTDGTKEILDN